MIRNQWYAILPSSAVKPGRITAVKRLNMELALFRSGSGKLGCVTDRCSHRGAALSKGKVTGNCIQCPFHGLEFDRHGKCTFIPANGKSSTADLSRYQVSSFLVREAHDIIYLWYGDPSLASGELPFFNQNIDESYVYSEIVDYWNSHYSRCIENQLDVVHLPFVHYNTIGRGNKTVVNGPKCISGSGFLITSANNEADSGQKPKPAEECVIRSTYLHFLFPNVWMNHISEHVKVVIYFAPIDDENTALYIRFYCNITASRLQNSIIAFGGKFANRIIERQDKRIVITQKPKASSYHSGEKLLSGDRPIVIYRQMREELKKAAAASEAAAAHSSTSASSESVSHKTP